MNFMCIIVEAMDTADHPLGILITIITIPVHHSRPHHVQAHSPGRAASPAHIFNSAVGQLSHQPVWGCTQQSDTDSINKCRISTNIIIFCGHVGWGARTVCGQRAHSSESIHTIETAVASVRAQFIIGRMTIKSEPNRADTQIFGD